MSEPTKYKMPKFGTKETIDCVSYVEYAKLKAKVERLQKAGDAVVATYVSKHFIDEPAIRDWRAAKV